MTKLNGELTEYLEEAITSRVFSSAEDEEFYQKYILSVDEKNKTNGGLVLTEKDKEFYQKCMNKMRKELSTDAIPSDGVTNEDREFYRMCINSSPFKGTTPINFYEEATSARVGELRNYPLDDFIIMALGITFEELEDYKGSPAPWNVVLEDILVRRGVLKDRGIMSVY